MFKTSSGLLNLILNFLIAVGLFFLFQSLGWIVITSSLSIWVIVLIAGVVNLLTGLLVQLIAVLLAPVWIVVASCTGDIGLLVVTGLVNYFTLKLTGLWIGMFILTGVWWQAILLGLAFAILHFSNISD